jgi:ATP-dependent RNA helicase DDX1
LELNFGATPFKFAPEDGYVGVSQAPSEHIQNSENSGPGSESKATNRPDNAPMCVIIEPTKELAHQTFEQIENFKKFLDTPKIR